MTTLIKTHLQHPIESVRDLVDFLGRGARPKSQWGIGVEMEKLVLDAETGEAAHYAQIEKLLRRLEDSTAWEGIRENDCLIGLKGPSSSITMEPGGQLELSGELCRDLHCSSRGYRNYIHDIIEAGEELGLIFLGLGVQPFTPLEKIDWLPKSRYNIMGPYMLRTGDMGQRMMKQSAGVQVNLDFSDEADCLDKMRLAMALSPLLYALFANSPIMEDRPTGFLSTRGEIWARTDGDRTGIIDRLYDADARLIDYVEYALDVPMYFIYRDNAYLDLTTSRFTFRQYLESGHSGHRATLGDWDLHLSTLFPEVRLRPQIEVRSADSLPPRLSLAVGALLKGLLYDSRSRSEAWDLFKPLTSQSRHELYRQSWRQALGTPFRDGRMQELAITVIALAKQGLARQKCLDIHGQDESIFLLELETIAQKGVSLAEQLLARWSGSRSEKLITLKNHCGFKL
ncbi:MAG: gamma-glutamylcysteine synthetase [Desulfuromonadaceae bacterium GWC2_58_13]|nr:MAG: gamma-glutamylcysteine synthetase [Desulfuromonadaceae bacterium GWC2_58_13]